MEQQANVAEREVADEPLARVDTVDPNIFDLAVGKSSLAMWETIVRLGLEPYIAQLDVLGYTVVPPEKLASLAFSKRLLEAVLQAGARQGSEIDMEGDGVDAQFGILVRNLLLEDEIFIEAALNPVVQALTSYLVGEHAVLSSYSALIKGRSNERDLPLHVDETRAPPPFAVHSQVCNITWILTDYSHAKGSVCFVPGSHHQLRAPRPGEGDDERIPVDAAAGSLIVWTGRTWHGAFARTEPGLRVNLLMPFFRPHLRTQENYREQVSPELVEKYPGLSTMLGMRIGYGWTDGYRGEYGAASHAMGRQRNLFEAESRGRSGTAAGVARRQEIRDKVPRPTRGRTMDGATSIPPS